MTTSVGKTNLLYKYASASLVIWLVDVALCLLTARHYISYNLGRFELNLLLLSSAIPLFSIWWTALLSLAFIQEDSRTKGVSDDEGVIRQLIGSLTLLVVAFIWCSLVGAALPYVIGTILFIIYVITALNGLGFVHISRGIKKLVTREGLI